MRLVWAISAALALGGCMEGAPPVSGAGGGGQGAEARKLSAGMTQAQAEAVFGLDAGFERNPANWDESCVSYAYGDAATPRYVHAVFRGDTLTRATDGHGAICTYGAAL
ncbi:hypothetical protein [Antarctobacter heliothermus]|uniref:SmpA / OmlA family protein n=1 Tax=Antarctobacter heliothermus TaxID=74033 RepID=A0A239C850_9RHOB|nr:hypothetical protein [Antarctobacter heliothermus]SNS15563.1 hypothetical protein SAMN04488078_1005138 [Antarctobacter heliothermus]